MRMSKAIALAIAAAGLGFGGAVVAQQTAPTQAVGLATPKTVTLDLGPEIEGMAGRQLRLRFVTLEPGGILPVHNHRDRPTVEFILKGSPTEFRGDQQRVVPEGEAVVSDRSTTHWWRNDTRETVTFIAADIFRPQ
jgi:quercetin dioxygenase-like cupin family protein